MKHTRTLRTPARVASVTLLVFALTGALPRPVEAQALPGNEPLLTGRWVGPQGGRALWIEFFGDSMLVVNDRHPLNYRLTRDSLVAWGDTSLVAAWEITELRNSQGAVTARYLLLFTDDGSTITLTPQDVIARPLDGVWLSAIGLGAESAELRLDNFGNARWRRLPDGGWTSGEWERETRAISIVWQPDSTVWTGIYDAEGSALLFDQNTLTSSTVIFRRRYR